MAMGIGCPKGSRMAETLVYVPWRLSRQPICPLVLPPHPTETGGDLPFPCSDWLQPRAPPFKQGGHTPPRWGGGVSALPQPPLLVLHEQLSVAPGHREDLRGTCVATPNPLSKSESLSGAPRESCGK